MKERPGGTVEEVDALRLHQLIDLETLFDVRLIKIDVEGAEWFVIKGISEHLKHFSPSTEWLVEVSKSALSEHGASFDQFVDLFRAAGYNMYAIDNGTMPAGTSGTGTGIWDSRSRTWCMPRHRMKSRSSTLSSPRDRTASRRARPCRRALRKRAAAASASWPPHRSMLTGG